MNSLLPRRAELAWWLAGLLACAPALASAQAGAAGDAPSLRMARELGFVPPTAAAASPSPLPASPVNRLMERVAGAMPSSRNCADQEAAPTRGVLVLTQALELMLCRSPAIRQAMEGVRAQSAALDIADATWWPRWNLYLERASNRIPSSNSGSGSLNESVTGSLGVSWVIFDFGVRKAGVEQARQALTSALASVDAGALAAIRDALKLYVEAAAAWARLDSLQQAEDLARQTADAARAKYDAQVASLSERLQADTAFAQATLERVRAQGAWRGAMAALAVAMGLPASSRVQLPDPSEGFPDLADEVPDAASLEPLREGHPRVRALQADVLAQQANLESIRAASKGSMSLSGSLAGTRQLGSNGGTLDRSISTSLLLSVPLFNGADQSAREALAASQIASRDALLLAVRREVDIALALALQQLDIERQSQEAARSLVNTATQGYEVALGRYRAGVGSILELLAAQTALSGARFQAVQATISRANAQISLAVAAGRLGTPGAAPQRR